MRFMPAVAVPETPRDLVFRASRLHAIHFVAAALAACAALIFRHFPSPQIAYFSASLILFTLSHRMIAARFHPQSWLVRVTHEGVFIHYRSFRKERMWAGDPTVVLVSLRRHWIGAVDFAKV